MSIRFVSFGFKFGAPVDADLILDVRFLDNPELRARLKHLPGTSPEVMSYVLDREETTQFVAKAEDLSGVHAPALRARRKGVLDRGRRMHRADDIARSCSPITWRTSSRRRRVSPSPSVHRDLGRQSAPSAAPDSDLLGGGGPKGGKGDHHDRQPRSPKGSSRIVNNLGLHARAATKLVQLASRFACDIEIRAKGKKPMQKRHGCPFAVWRERNVRRSDCPRPVVQKRPYKRSAD